MTSTLLQAAYKAIDDKHGEDIVVLNMQGISLLADYFLLLLMVTQIAKCKPLHANYRM